MKKYYLSSIKQKTETFYSLVADPRVIIRLIDDVKPGEEQESQRPWSENKVKEIAEYVASGTGGGNGLIPNAPIINVKSMINVKSDDKGEYIELPETNQEFHEYAGTVEVIDGQHRLRAFKQDYLDVDFSSQLEYQMLFSVFIQLVGNTKKGLFTVTNEKQDKVPSNLLRLFKHQLGLLDTDQELVYNIVAALNTEDVSPIKGRIMIGAKKIRGGYQENQVSQIIIKAKILPTLNKMIKKDSNYNEKIIKAISYYLKAWENVYGISLKVYTNKTIYKVSGLRYILRLVPAVFEILQNQKQEATIQNIKSKIDDLHSAIDTKDIFASEVFRLAFRADGATTALANDHAGKLNDYVLKNNESFSVL